MKLTVEQRSEIISEMASSEAGFNELMRVLLDSFSKQERALFLDEHKGEQGNGSVLVVGVGTVVVFNFASLALARVLFSRLYSASWLLRKGSVRCFFMSCRLVDFPVKTSGESFLPHDPKILFAVHPPSLDDIARDGGCCIKKTSRRRSAEMPGM